MSEWQSIETAPKRTDWRHDDARIIATDGNIVSTSYWSYSSNEWRNESECEDYGYPGEGSCPGHASWKPTHWMPLPPPPEAKNA